MKLTSPDPVKIIDSSFDVRLDTPLESIVTFNDYIAM